MTKPSNKTRDRPKMTKFSTLIKSLAALAQHTCQICVGRAEKSYTVDTVVHKV